MNVTRVSQKGQIVIPAAVRKALGLKPGMRVNVTVDGNNALITPERADKRVTLDEIQALLKYSGPTVPISAMRPPGIIK